jgi:hypothetical protein
MKQTWRLSSELWYWREIEVQFLMSYKGGLSNQLSVIAKSSLEVKKYFLFHQILKYGSRVLQVFASRSPWPETLHTRTSTNVKVHFQSLEKLHEGLISVQFTETGSMCQPFMCYTVCTDSEKAIRIITKHGLYFMFQVCL